MNSVNSNIGDRLLNDTVVFNCGFILKALAITLGVTDSRNKLKERDVRDFCAAAKIKQTRLRLEIDSIARGRNGNSSDILHYKYNTLNIFTMERDLLEDAVRFIVACKIVRADEVFYRDERVSSFTFADLVKAYTHFESFTGSISKSFTERCKNNTGRALKTGCL